MIIFNGPWKVYIHLNKINGKMYVGITSTSLQKRFGNNGSGYSKHNIKLWRAIQKYGWEYFEHILFADNLTEVEANEMEKLLINNFDTIQNGYNCREGGKSGKLSEETKTKIREKRAKQVISRESLEKTFEKTRGKKKPDGFGEMIRERKRKYMKKVYCEETKQVYESISSAAKALNITKSSVSRVCNKEIS